MSEKMIGLGYGLFIEESILDSLENEEVRRLPLFCSPEEVAKNIWEYRLYADQEKVREDWSRQYEVRLRKNGNSYYVDITDFGRYPDDRPEIIRVWLEKMKKGEYTVVKSYRF